MSALRSSAFVALTLVLTAFFSSFAWSEDRAPHAFRVEVSGHGRPRLPRLHFVLSDAARHFIMFDDPSWYFEQLDAFLRDPAAAIKVHGFDDK